MLLESYPEEKEEIEKHLERIGYEDYQMSGALLEAIMSSCNNINDIFEVIQRELA